MVLQAGRDVSLTAAQVSHQGDGGSTSIIAGRDISLNTVTTGSTDNLQWGKTGCTSPPVSRQAVR